MQASTKFVVVNIFNLDIEKMRTSVLYIISKADSGVIDYYKIFKILYFADQKHLKTYGRPIAGDKYIAMENGPVPSSLYDNIKWMKTEATINNSYLKGFVEVSDGYMVKAVNGLSADLEALSESDIEALDSSIAENIGLDFGDLKIKSHDTAWNETDLNQPIDIIKIAHAGGANASMLSYIKQNN